MRHAAIALAVILVSCTSPVFAQEVRFRDGRFLETLGGVTLQRADEASSDEAVMNMPFLPGDRVWTDESGRAEIVFADGEILWIAERSKVDSLGRGGREQDERLGLRVFAGSFGARVRSGGPGFEFRAPGGSVTSTGASAFRVDVRMGETVLTVSEGEVLADLAGERLTLRSGERVRYTDRGIDGPYKVQRGSVDRFDLWCEERFHELSRMARSQTQNERLPDELEPYADELNRHGDWVYQEPQGYVYVPRVAYDWAPYTYGRWAFTLYGWTWIAAEPWGFVTSHYGRWGYSANIGWHWMPRTGFSGAWVSWSTPVGAWSNTIGWCALGYNDRPVGSAGYGSGYGSGGYAVPRGDVRSAPGRGWNYANRSDLGRASIQRRRVDLPLEEAQRAVVWNPGTAPDREFRRSFEPRSRSASGGAVRRDGDGRTTGNDGAPRVYARPSPGDSQSELRADPTTTIPTPESRRARTIGQDGFKEEQDRKSQQRDSAFYGEVFVSPAAGEAPRPRKTNAPAAEPQASPTSSGNTNDAAKTNGSRDQTTRDPLLNRFFRSITRSDADRAVTRDPNAPRDANANRSNEDSAHRRETAPRDDSSARDSNARERQRPTEARPADENRDQNREQNRERTRPSGSEHTQPRRNSAPPPQATPRGGSSDDHATRRKPGQDR
jgi:hypothetical protein